LDSSNITASRTYAKQQTSYWRFDCVLILRHRLCLFFKAND